MRLVSCARPETWQAWHGTRLHVTWDSYLPWSTGVQTCRSGLTAGWRPCPGWHTPPWPRPPSRPHTRTWTSASSDPPPTCVTHTKLCWQVYRHYSVPVTEICDPIHRHLLDALQPGPLHRPRIIGLIAVTIDTCLLGTGRHVTRGQVPRTAPHVPRAPLLYQHPPLLALSGDQEVDAVQGRVYHHLQPGHGALHQAVRQLGETCLYLMVMIYVCTTSKNKVLSIIMSIMEVSIYIQIFHAYECVRLKSFFLDVVQRFHCKKNIEVGVL